MPKSFREGISNPVVRGERNIHGVRHIPDGYTLAVLPSNTHIEPDFAGAHGEIQISFSYNVIQAVISVVQVFFASFTLYRSRGDQLKQYGYAAFGLTVIPYIIMSIFNLFGNVLNPDYPTLYLVRSPEMREAENRGGHFDGVIGTVVEEEGDGEQTYLCTKTDGGFTLRTIPTKAPGTSTLVTDSKIEGINSNQEEIITPTPNEKSMNIETTHCVEQLLNDDRKPPNPQTFIIGSKQVGSFYPGERRGNITFLPLLPTVLRNGSVTQTRIDIRAAGHFKKHGKKAWGEEKFTIWIFFTFYILAAIPWAVIGGLTRFRSGHSTKSQRVWTMGWLGFGTFFGALFPILIAIYGSVSPLKVADSKRKWKIQKLLNTIYISSLYSAFAFGGFVVVGQMLVQYGTCNTLS